MRFEYQLQAFSKKPLSLSKHPIAGGPAFDLGCSIRRAVSASSWLMTKRLPFNL